MTKETEHIKESKGYKKTKLGWIPKEWEVTKIGKILKIGSGKDYKHLSSGDIPVIGTGGIMTYVDNYLFDGESVGIGRKGTIDKPQFLNGKFWTVDTLFYTHSFNKTLAKYVYYLFSTINWYRFNEASGVPSLSKNTIEKILITLPPLPEQQKIATILSTWDKCIALQTELIAAKEQQKKGLMQQLLSGEVRLRDENGKRFEGEWKEVKLGEVAEIDRNSLKSNTDSEYTFRYVSLSDVNEGIISDNLTEYSFGNSPSRARRIVKTNSVIMATVRPNLQAFSIVKRPKDIIVSTGFAVIDHKEDLSPEYLIQYLFSKHITSQIEGLIVGTNYPAINSSDVRNLKIKLPTIQEQQKIAAVLSAADREIALLKQELTVLEQQKKGLMQVLLTGEVRVKS
jgi:type I restriction enzyme, S subunit